MARLFSVRPSGQEKSMLEVRRTDPGARNGAGPADCRGGFGRTSFTNLFLQKTVQSKIRKITAN
jgi:hypothetical protein